MVFSYLLFFEFVIYVTISIKPTKPLAKMAGVIFFNFKNIVL